MKKILLALMLFSSYSFALPNWYSYNGSSFSMSQQVISHGDAGESLCGTHSVGAFSVSYYNGSLLYLDQWISETPTSNGYCRYYFDEGKYITNTCPSPKTIINGECTDSTPTCTATQHLVNNICVNNPVCVTGSHLDTTSNTCVGDFPQKAVVTLDSGNKYVIFEDDAMMYCKADISSCTTTDKFGNQIPNRFYALKVPDETSELLDFSASVINSAYIGAKNMVGLAIEALGFNITAVTDAGVALDMLYDTNNFAHDNVFPTAYLGAGLMVMGKKLQSWDDTIYEVPKYDGSGVNVLFDSHSKESVNISSFTPSDGSSAPIPNTPLVAEKVTQEKLKTIWDNAPGAGTLPKNALVLGSDIIYNPTDPSKVLVETPDKVIVAQTNPDKSQTILEMNKADILNTKNTGADLPVTQKVIQPEKISNDGKVSQTQETTQSTVSPTKNETTTFNKSTGLPDVVDYNPRTGLKDGNLYNSSTGLITSPGAGTGGGSPTGAPTKDANGSGTGSIDLSGVTGRLDKLNNQLTKINDVLTPKTEKPFSSNPENPIDTSKLDGLTDIWKSAYDGLKSDMSQVSSMADGAKNTINQGLSSGLVGGSISTCPYTVHFDDGKDIINFDIDFCKVLSPLRSTFTVLFNIIFQFLLLLIAYKFMMKLV